MSDSADRLQGLAYRDGLQDCYGLVRRYYAEEYGMLLRNYARPVGFDHEGLDLLAENFAREGFQAFTGPLGEISPGDGLLFRILSPRVNHVGVVTQTPGLFLHHLYGRPSTLEPLDRRWTQRLAMVVRHPDIEEMNKARQGFIRVDEHLPPHLRGGV